MYKPRVSVLIPCFNAVEYIEETVKSVISQDYPNLEIIIRDDCSTDRTWEKVMRLSEIFPIKTYQNINNLGMCGNWNKIFEDATGDFFLKLDADDILEGGVLTIAINTFEKEQSIDAVAFAYKILDSETKSELILDVHKELEPGLQKNLFSTIFFKNPFHLCFTIFKKEALLLLQEDNKVFLETEIGDLDFLLRFAKRPFNLYFVEQFGGYYRYHTNNSSKEPLKQAKSWLEDVFPRHSDYLYTHYKKQTTRTLNLRIIHYIKSLYTFRQKPNLNYLANSIKTYLKFKYGKI